MNRYDCDCTPAEIAQGRPMVEHGPCAWCGVDQHLDRELQGACCAEHYRLLRGGGD